MSASLVVRLVVRGLRAVRRRLLARRRPPGSPDRGPVLSSAAAIAGTTSAPIIITSSAMASPTPYRRRRAWMRFAGGVRVTGTTPLSDVASNSMERAGLTTAHPDPPVTDDAVGVQRSHSPKSFTTQSGEVTCTLSGNRARVKPGKGLLGYSPRAAHRSWQQIRYTCRASPGGCSSARCRVTGAADAAVSLCRAPGPSPVRHL